MAVVTDYTSLFRTMSVSSIIALSGDVIVNLRRAVTKMIKHIESKQVAVKETKQEMAVRRAAEAAFEAAADAFRAAEAHLFATSARVGNDHEECRAAYRAYTAADGAMQAARRAIPEAKTKTVRTQWTEY